MENPEFDEFMSKVQEVHQTVKGLADGKADVTEADALIAKLEAEKDKPKGEDKKKTAAPVSEPPQIPSQSRPGKGVLKDYAWFCRRCHLEYLNEAMKQCDQCQGDLQSGDDRRQELHDKVQELLKQKERRKAKRERFEAWKKAHAAENKMKRASYESWDIWEPSSDEEDMPEPTGPQFQALEADLEARKQRRLAAEKEALQFKAEGNKYFKDKSYAKAIDEYSKAIEKHKDNKSLYTNRALCYIKLGQFENAIKDCNTVMDIFDFFDHKRLKDSNRMFIFKAYIRRAMSRRAQKEYDEAIADCMAALEIRKDDKDAGKLLAELRLEVDEAKKLKEITESKVSEEERKVLYSFVTMLRQVAGLEESTEPTDQKNTVAVLLQAVKQIDPSARAVLFREAKGFEALFAVFKNLFAAESLSSEQATLFMDFTNFGLRLCQNPLNLQIVASSFIPVSAFEWVEKRSLEQLNKHEVVVYEKCVHLMAELSLHEATRKALSAFPKRFMDWIQELMSVAIKPEQESLLDHTLCVFSNLVTTVSVKNAIREREVALRDDASRDKKTFFKTLLRLLATGSVDITQRTIAALTNLSHEPFLRQYFVSMRGGKTVRAIFDLLFDACAAQSPVMDKALGLTMNLALEETFIKTAPNDASVKLLSALKAVCEKETTPAVNRVAQLLCGVLARLLKDEGVRNEVSDEDMQVLFDLAETYPERFDAAFYVSLTRCMAILSQFRGDLVSGAYRKQHRILVEAHKTLPYLGMLKANLETLCANVCIFLLNSSRYMPETALGTMHLYIGQLVALLKRSDLPFTQKNAAILLSFLSRNKLNVMEIQRHKGMPILKQIGATIVSK